MKRKTDTNDGTTNMFMASATPSDTPGVNTGKQGRYQNGPAIAISPFESLPELPRSVDVVIDPLAAANAVNNANLARRIENGDIWDVSLLKQTNLPFDQWRPLDERGVPTYIHKSQLHRDPRYQRDIANATRNLQRAIRWSWQSYSRIKVYERDGKYYVFDGWQSKLSADLRPDIECLPCEVFKSPGRKEEALHFEESNTRTAVTAVQKFYAKLAAGNPRAKHIAKVLAKTGHRIANTSATDPKAVGCTLTAFRMDVADPALFEEVWPLLAEVCKYDTVTDKIAWAIWGVEHRCRKVGLTLTKALFMDILVNLQGRELAKILKSYNGPGSGAGRAANVNALVYYLNKRKLGRKNRIPTDGDAAENVS